MAETQHNIRVRVGAGLYDRLSRVLERERRHSHRTLSAQEFYEYVIDTGLTLIQQSRGEPEGTQNAITH